MVFGTSNMFIKSAPAYPVFITKIFQRMQEQSWEHLRKIFFISENLEFSQIWKVWVLIFWTFGFRIFEVFVFSKLWILLFEISEDGHRTMMNIPVKNLQTPGYEFHIYQKTWNGHLVKFLFSSKGILSTPQHSDSHPCIRPRWSCSLSGWS